MSGDDKLRTQLNELVRPRDHYQLPSGRECRFRLIEDVETMSAEAMRYRAILRGLVSDWLRERAELGIK